MANTLDESTKAILDAAAQATRLAKAATELTVALKMAQSSSAEEERLNTIAREAATLLSSPDVMAQQLAAIEQSAQYVRSIQQAKSWIPTSPQGLSPAEHPEAFTPDHAAHAAANSEAARLSEYHPWLDSSTYNPDPAEQFIARTGPSVWRIVGQFAVELDLDSPNGYRELLSTSIDAKMIETVAAYYEVPIEAIQAALEHARLYPEAVVARLVADRSTLPDRTPA